MSNQRKVLGRGLSNLLPELDQEKITLQDNPNYQEIALDCIVPNPKQPRKHFIQEDLEGLAKTLESVGVIEPVVVRPLLLDNMDKMDKMDKTSHGPQKERYQLIAGERRWRAAKLAGFKKIPAVLKQANELQALEIGIIENIQRKDLNPVEEARTYEYWMKVTQQKADVLAKKVGKNRSTIKNLTRILKLPPETLELIEKKELSIGQARPLLGIGDRQELHKLALKICKEAWNARRVEEEVAQLIEKQSSVRGSVKLKPKDPNIANIEKALRTGLSARVELQHKKNGNGKITIYYGNLEDRERLIEHLRN